MDRVCILLSPPPSNSAQKQPDWTFQGCVTSKRSPLNRAREDTHPKAAHSFVTARSRSTKESDSVISKSWAYLQELQTWLPARQLWAAHGAVAWPCFSLVKPREQGDTWPTSVVIWGWGSVRAGLAWFPQAHGRNSIRFWLQGND